MSQSKRATAATVTLSNAARQGGSSINPIHMELMMQSNIMLPGKGATLCPICGTTFTPARRSQRTCTEACKKRLARSEKRDGKRSFSPSRIGLSQRAQKAKNSIGQPIDNINGAVPVFDDLSPSSPLVFERINEVTVKVTDGVKIRHTGGPAFAGSDQPRAVAWLMDIGWPTGRQAWVARMGELSYGPTTFAKAKRAALLMVRGGFEEPVARLTDPVGFLMRQQADLLSGLAVAATVEA